MLFENITWFLAFLSLAGNIFVVKKNVIGQWIWAISNIGWVIINITIGMYAQAFLFGVYFFLCIWGIIAWSKEAKVKTA